ncbi:hypothetical protein BD779DRAFT_342588 [Infundibulicybe gibba]|nr:hypothetical protein BD779DRAFT_342588 [Infundibulicybe gibba]
MTWESVFKAGLKTCYSYILPTSFLVAPWLDPLYNMSESSPAVVDDITLTSDIPGPIFLGAILNWGLFCCLVVQVYIYHVSSKNDRIGLKILVYFLFLAAIVQICFATLYAWQVLVLSWNKTPGFLHKDFLTKAQERESYLPLINGIISAVVQIFFSWRIWFLNRTVVGQIFAALIGIIVITQTVFSIAMFSTVYNASRATTMVWLGCGLIADVLIASSMLYALRKAQHQSLSKGAKTIISRLMVIAFETGAITVVAASIEIVLMLPRGVNSNYYQTITFIIGPL